VSATTPSPLFTGKQVIIRPLTPADAPLYHQWLQNPVFSAYKPYLKRLCPTSAQLLTHLALQAQVKPRSEIEGLVIHQKTQTPIGLIGLAAIDRFNQKAEFSAGFVRGYGTSAIWEAIHAGITLSFARFQLYKLIAYVAPSNHQALNMMQRYGFINEGYFKEEILIDEEQRMDLYRFALMRSAWEEHPLHQRLKRIAPITLSSITNSIQ